MKSLAQFIGVAMLLAGSACHDMEHTRQVDNAAVPGKTIALQVCSNCHGVRGVSVSPTFPKLAGQPHDYIVAQLTDLRSHKRADPNAQRYMWGFTHLTDKQIDELATYFSMQKTELGAADQPEVMEKGRSIYAHGLPDHGVAACITCHGQHGEGKAEFPRLAGQHSEYVVRQLDVFRHTDSRPRGQVMKEVCANMTDEEMQAVAAYVEAFPPEIAEAGDEDEAQPAK
jgi:cytochrome c553